MGNCSVSVTSTSYFVFTTHKTHDGLGILAPPFFKDDVDSAPSKVGTSIMNALRSSETGFDYSTRNPDAILQFSGYRSWRAFERDSFDFTVGLDGDDRVTIIPSDPAPKGGFLHRPDKARTCRMNADEIGETLFEMVQTKREEIG